MDRHNTHIVNSPNVKRTLFPYFLSGSLLLLMIGASVIGYFAYQNFNHIISALEDEIKPNGDLVILSDISSQLEQVETAMEGYVLNQNQEYMQQFKDGIQNALSLTQSLKERNTDPDFLAYTDTLDFLIKTKNTVLIQLSELDYVSLENTLEQVQQEIEQKKALPATTENALPKKKKRFFEKIFSRKKSEETTDTEPATPSRQLDSLVKSAGEKVATTKQKELSLYLEHQLIDGRILSTIASMEHALIQRIKQLALNAQKQARNTNKYIMIFSVIAPVVILGTLTLLIIYVSRTRRHQNMLKVSKEHALKVAKEKEQFLANMSHEIRTPMNAIAGFSQLLLKTNLAPEQKEQLSIIAKSSDHLIHILNDVLDFTKLQSGKITLEQKVFNPGQIINETIQLLSHKAHEKNLTLKSEINELPPLVQGDPFRLKQILLNLIFNSIKFTEQGSITVRAKSTVRKNKIQLHLEVADTGIGIPADRQVKIFEDFEQVSRGDMQRGTGLGLSITKKLVNLHKGHIKLKSTEGEGTTFTVKLPYDKTDQTEEVQAKPQKTAYQLEGIHTLIADDEAFNRKLLETILSSHSISFDEAEDGQICYDKLTQNKYDLLLLDFRMPGMNGPEVAEKIRAEQGPNQDVPIIGLTATVSDQDMELAKLSGINHVLRKPFDTDELLTIMEKSVKKESSPRKTEPVENTQPTPEYTLDGLKKMGDDRFVKDMIETFINNTHQNLEKLDQAAVEKNWDQTADVIHKIIAPVRHFKARQLASFLKEKELAARAGTPLQEKDLKKIHQELLALVDSLQLYLRQT